MTHYWRGYPNSNGALIRTEGEAMREYLPSKRTAKAVAAGVVSLAAYLTGVIPSEGGFGDVSTVQWLGAVVFLGAAYGITYQVSNRPQPARGEDGEVTVALVFYVTGILFFTVAALNLLGVGTRGVFG